MNFKDLPKVELHCHLDGSLRVDTVLELMKEEGIDLGYKSYGEIKNILVVPNDCPSLKEYLKRFDLPLKLMQSRKNLKRIAYELIEDVNKENVKWNSTKLINGKYVVRNEIDGEQKVFGEFDTMDEALKYRIECMRKAWKL